MSEVEPAAKIDEDAAEWAVKRETHSADPAFVAELDAWLAADSRRVGALLRAEAALSYLNRGRALAGGQPDVAPRVGRRKLLIGGAIAALAASVGGLALLLPQEQSIGTMMGEVRKVPLSDGSLVAVNTSSEVVVALTPETRKLSLVKGEAWFKVAHDTQRPFVVEAGPVRVRALGTAFSVRRNESGADVLVTEGTVETWAVGEENHRIKLSAGNKAVLGMGRPPQAVAANDQIENELAWRNGEIVLYGQTLADAAAEFNRYNARKVVISDPQLAAETMVGRFNADEPEAFAHAAALATGARVTQTDSTLQLTRNPSR
ncbi:FecR family protein [Steroidobacter flavus]|uniref:FecR family protein n=1 Tax=Steroidobacter flavus TaxID=1842136 RepID=A0ABV8SZV4_9GAMM